MKKQYKVFILIFIAQLLIFFPPVNLFSQDSAEDYIERGINFAVNMDFDSAIIEFSGAIRLEPGLARAWQLRGRAYYAKASRVAYILKDFSVVDAYMTSGHVSPDLLPVYNLAASDFTQSILLDPNNTQVYAERARLNVDIGSYATVMSDCNRSIALNPKYAEPHIILGMMYYDFNNYSRAFDHFERAILADSLDSTAYSWRGFIYDHLGDYANAIADYSESIRLNPGIYSIYNLRGMIYYSLGDFDLALADFESVISLDRTNEDAYVLLSLIYLIKENQSQSMANINQAIRLNSAEYEYYYIRGIIHYNFGNINNAITDFTRAINNSHEFKDYQLAAIYNNRGDAYYSIRRYDLAVVDYDKAYRIEPDNPEYLADLENARKMIRR